MLGLLHYIGCPKCTWDPEYAVHLRVKVYRVVQDFIHPWYGTTSAKGAAARNASLVSEACCVARQGAPLRLSGLGFRF